MRCKAPPEGWECYLEEGHEGPCPTYPIGSLKTDYTHKGWFGLCPVYLYNIDRDPIGVAPRWNFVIPLFTVSEWIQGGLIWLCTLINPMYVPYWKIRVTGELND